MKAKMIYQIKYITIKVLLFIGIIHVRMQLMISTWFHINPKCVIKEMKTFSHFLPQMNFE